jgi:hypothetical protein
MLKNQYEKRIVAFIDILGFKNIVENTDKAFTIINIISNVKKSKKKLIKEIRETKIEITWFSDCIVISTPMNIYYLNLLLAILQEIQLELIQNEILIRGGISMGDCFHNKDKLFGPAMNKAYKLESSQAKVPRIIIDEEIIKFIDEVHIEEESSMNKEYEQELELYREYDIEEITDIYLSVKTTAQEIYKDLIVKDRDGYYFVNYLDEIFKMCIHTKGMVKRITKSTESNNHVISLEDFEEYYNELFQGIIVPLQNFIKDNLSANQMDVILKYVWLKEYYNIRLETYKSSLSEEDFMKEIYSKMFIAK